MFVDFNNSGKYDLYFIYTSNHTYLSLFEVIQHIDRYDTYYSSIQNSLQCKANALRDHIDVLFYYGIFLYSNRIKLIK